MYTNPRLAGIALAAVAVIPSGAHAATFLNHPDQNASFLADKTDGNMHQTEAAGADLDVQVDFTQADLMKNLVQIAGMQADVFLEMPVDQALQLMADGHDAQTTAMNVILTASALHFAAKDTGNDTFVASMVAIIKAPALAFGAIGELRAIATHLVETPAGQRASLVEVVYVDQLQDALHEVLQATITTSSAAGYARSASVAPSLQTASVGLASKASPGANQQATAGRWPVMVGPMLRLGDEVDTHGPSPKHGRVRVAGDPGCVAQQATAHDGAFETIFIGSAGADVSVQPGSITAVPRGAFETLVAKTGERGRDLVATHPRGATIQTCTVQPGNAGTSRTFDGGGPLVAKATFGRALKTSIAAARKVVGGARLGEMARISRYTPAGIGGSIKRRANEFGSYVTAHLGRFLGFGTPRMVGA